MVGQPATDRHLLPEPDRIKASRSDPVTPQPAVGLPGPLPPQVPNPKAKSRLANARQRNT